MKVGELREKLSKLKKEEVAKLAVEFYKLIPKAKKEDYAIDDMINNPRQPKKARTTKAKLSLVEIGIEVERFIENAKAQNYLVPNREVPKKERATWRFKVKKWYKELTNTKRHDADLNIQTTMLTQLYELMCEACEFQYFSAYDAFDSTGISQHDFYHSVITLLQESEGKSASVKKGITLVVNNALNRYTLYSGLMEAFIETLNIPDLKYQGIEIVKELLVKNNFDPGRESKDKYRSFYKNDYEKEWLHNNLVEFGARFYMSLLEWDEAIHFYKEHYYQDREEVKLYILVRMLFEKREKEHVKQAIEQAIEKKIQPRKNLLSLLDQINETGELPDYMR